MGSRDKGVHLSFIGIRLVKAEGQGDTLERGRLRGVYRVTEEEGVYRRVGVAVGPVLRVELRTGGNGQGFSTGCFDLA